MSLLNTLVLSHATYNGPSGATAAATYSFLTKEYKPPTEPRALDKDVVVNQNGKFKYIYDNGPGFKQWAPFSVACEERLSSAVGGFNAAQQYAHLREMWEHRGVLGMQTPDGTYTVAWSNDLERNFRVFPAQASSTAPIEYQVVVQFEEAS